MAGIDWTTGDEGIKVADGQCAQFDVLQDNGTPANCMIQACNQRGDGASQPMNVFNGPTEYGLLKQWCKPDGAGGNAPDGGPVIVVALNNPEFQPPSSVKRATGGKIRAKTVTIEEHKAIVEKARQASVKPVPAPSSRLLKRVSIRTSYSSLHLLANAILNRKAGKTLVPRRTSEATSATV